MINPYQASQTSNALAGAAPSPRTVTRQVIDAVLIWFGVVFGAHAGVAMDEGYDIQAAANRGLSDPMQKLYIFQQDLLCSDVVCGRNVSLDKTVNALRQQRLGKRPIVHTNACLN